MNMRWAGVGAIILFGCSHAPATVSISSLPPLPRVALATREDPPPPNAVRIDSSRDADWARAFPRAKNFVAVEIPATRTLLVSWRMGRTHRVKDLAPDEDYPANYVAPIDLVIGPETIGFGELSGGASPASQSYCTRRGWHTDEPVELPRYVVSRASVGTMQGDSELMIVRDGQTLHVLHRETSDGRCDEAKQGPLDVCEGFGWELRADVHLGGDPALFERIDEGNEAKPFDCGKPLVDGTHMLH